MTRESRTGGVQGTVRLSLRLDSSGHAEEIKVEKGLGFGLDEEALKAVSQWQFAPPTQECRDLRFYFDVNFSFR